MPSTLIISLALSSTRFLRDRCLYRRYKIGASISTHNVRLVLSSVIRTWKSQLSQTIVNATIAIDNPKERAILSTQLISLLKKKTKLQAKPGKKRMNIAPNSALSTSNTIIINSLVILSIYETYNQVRNRIFYSPVSLNLAIGIILLKALKSALLNSLIINNKMKYKVYNPM